MPSILRFLGRALVVLILALAVAFVIAPREPVERSGAFAGDLSDPAAYLAAREARVPDLVPGAEARIVWAAAEGARSDLAVLYLHGFSATSEEIRPVPDRVAEALGANLIFSRLAGHGRNGAAMAGASAGDWIDDTAEALALARAVGDRVLIIGTSTGGTLAALAMTEPDMAEGVAGVVFVSPNMDVSDPAGRLLGWPGARWFVPWLVGPERGFPPVNEMQERYWTERYPSLALVPLGALLAEARSRDYSDVQIPALFLFSDADQVVSVQAVRALAADWGGQATVAPQVLPAEGADPFAHVIAGDILSPAMTDPVIARILDWAAILTP